MGKTVNEGEFTFDIFIAMITTLFYYDRRILKFTLCLRVIQQLITRL